MEYTVVSAGDLTQLIHDVADWMASGWKPQGGICFGAGHFLQAMIRVRDE